MNLLHAFYESYDPYAEPELTKDERYEWYRKARHGLEEHKRSVEAQLKRVVDRVNAVQGQNTIVSGLYNDATHTQLRSDGFYFCVDNKYLPLAASRIPLIRAFNRIWEAYKDAAALETKLNKYIDQYERERRATENAGTLATYDRQKASLPTVNINPANIPASIVIPGRSKKGIANPYYFAKNPSDRYAGSPYGVSDMHVSQKVILAKLQQLLIDNGIPPLSVMYWSHTKYYSWIAFNPTLSVVWLKKQTSSQDPVNDVYLAGDKISTSTLMSADERKQLALLKSAGLIK